MVRLDRGLGLDCGWAKVYHYIERIVPREVKHPLPRSSSALCLYPIPRSQSAPTPPSSSVFSLYPIPRSQSAPHTLIFICIHSIPHTLISICTPYPNLHLYSVLIYTLYPDLNLHPTPLSQSAPHTPIFICVQSLFPS